jgi:hypothetical protein
MVAAVGAPKLQKIPYSTLVLWAEAHRLRHCAQDPESGPRDYRGDPTHLELLRGAAGKTGVTVP